MTKSDKLNILISQPQWFLDTDGTRKFGPVICVRHSYCREIRDELLPDPETPSGQYFAATRETFDPEKGVYRNVYPTDKMRQFINDLRAAWGPLHVQDNSGLLPDLDQGYWPG